MTFAIVGALALLATAAAWKVFGELVGARLRSVPLAEPIAYYERHAVQMASIDETLPPGCLHT